MFYTKNQSLKMAVSCHGPYHRQRYDGEFQLQARRSPCPLGRQGEPAARGKSDEARRLNQDLDNIKAQIGKHYQYLSDHDSLLTAKRVYDRYNGFGDEVHSLMEIFDSQIEDYRRQIGKTKAESTYRGLVNDRKCLLHYLKDKLGVGKTFRWHSLDLDFIKGFYNWMLSVRGLSKSTAFERINTMKWLMYKAVDDGWLRKHPFKKFECRPEYKKRPFLSEEDLLRLLRVKLSYKRQRAFRDMFVFMCFSGLAHADLKELTYKNIHTDSDGGTWLTGNRVKTKVPYVVKLLPIAVELIERYRDVREGKDTPDKVFPAGNRKTMEDSLKRIGEKAGCSVRLSPHVGRHTYATLTLTKGMPLETLQRVLGHKNILSTQVYAELINPKVGEDTDKVREKIGDMYCLDC